MDKYHKGYLLSFLPLYKSSLRKSWLHFKPFTLINLNWYLLKQLYKIITTKEKECIRCYRALNLTSTPNTIRIGCGQYFRKSSQRMALCCRHCVVATMPARNIRRMASPLSLKSAGDRGVPCIANPLTVRIQIVRYLNARLTFVPMPHC